MKAELQKGWQRFWGLSWKIKGPIMAVVAIIIIGAGASGGGDEEPSKASADDQVTATATAKEEKATNTPKPSETPKPTNTPRPTETPRPTAPVVGSETLYRNQVQSTSAALAKDFTKLSGFLSDPKANAQWLNDTSTQISVLIVQLSLLRTAEPPSAKYEAFDKQLDDAATQYIAALNDMDAALKAGNATGFTAASAKMSTATAAFNAANAIFPAQ